jgi:hypothetical protein
MFNASTAQLARRVLGRRRAPFPCAALPAAVDAGAVVGVAWSNASIGIIVWTPARRRTRCARAAATIAHLERRGIRYALDVALHRFD